MRTNSRHRLGSVIGLMVTGALVLATSCAGPGSAGSEEGAIRVGLLANLTGEAAASFGIPFKRGLELALGDAQSTLQDADVPIDLLTEDARSSVPAAVTGYNKLKQQGAPVVINDSQSPLGQAVAPLANEDRIAFLSGAGSKLENPKGYAFRFTDLRTPTTRLGERLIEQGAERVGAVIASDNPSFATLADVTEQALPNGYASRQEISSSDTNFASVLANLREDNVDAVVLSVLPAQAGNLLQQMQQSGGFEDVSKAGTLATSKETYTVAKDAAGGFVFPQVWAPGAEGASVFETRYADKYDEAPTSYAALGYQVGWIMTAALIDAHETGEVNGTSIRDALPSASTSELVSEHGILDLKLTADGQAVSDGVMATFAADGTVKAVEN